MLYFIKSNDFYKIGFTNNLTNRIKNYLTTNPEFTLLGIKIGTKDDEAHYHYKLYEFLTKGEWMRLNENIVSELIEEFNEPVENHLHTSLLYTTTDGWWNINYSKRRVFKKIRNAKKEQYKLTKKEILEAALNIISKDKWYTKSELEELFYDNLLIDEPKFNNSFIRGIFNNFDSKRQIIKGKQYIFYKFNSLIPEVKSETAVTVPTWITDNLEENWYTSEELEIIFTPIFKEHGLVYNTQYSINTYFPKYERKRISKNRERKTYYRFKL